MKSMKGGLTAYDKSWYRCKSLKFVNKNYDAQGKLIRHPFSIEGEPYAFDKFMKTTCMKEELEVIVDFDHVFHHKGEAARLAKVNKGGSKAPVILITLVFIVFMVHTFFL